MSSLVSYNVLVTGLYCWSSVEHMNRGSPEDYCHCLTNDELLLLRTSKSLNILARFPPWLTSIPRKLPLSTLYDF
jgi:hypothetical protein